jgi:hypothetical protein
MAFTRSSEPFQEPPQPRSHGSLMIGIAILLVFFVPLLVVIAMDSRTVPVQAATGPSSSLRLPPRPAGPPLPPLPPPGAPWPPPPGAPVPPVCALEYRVAADGVTVTAWTALTTVAGELTVESASAGSVHRHDLSVTVGVQDLALPAPLAQEHDLHAVLSGSAGQTFNCLVGPEA